MMDLSLSKPDEIVKRLCERLRTERLAQQMTQADVAGRAGIGTNTVSNLEAGRSVGFENLVRVASSVVAKNWKACSCQNWTALRTCTVTNRPPNVSASRGSTAMSERVRVYYEGWG